MDRVRDAEPTIKEIKTTKPSRATRDARIAAIQAAASAVVPGTHESRIFSLAAQMENWIWRDQHIEERQSD